MTKKHVFFIMPDIRSGGVGRMRLIIIKHLVSKGVECTLVLRKKKGELLLEAEQLCDIYEVAPDNIFQIIPRLSKIIQDKKPTHIITCFQDLAFLVWISMKISKVNTVWIHSVHTSIKSSSYSNLLSERIKYLINNKVLLKFILKKTQKIVSVSKGIKEELDEYFKKNKNEIDVIYNPVIEDDFNFNAKTIDTKNKECINITSIGRLCPQKGFDVLIKSIPYVNRNVRLDIYGEGEERGTLEKLIIKFSLQGKVFLHGYTDDPIGKIKKSDIFILSSRSEGFGNVLVEALACGIQIISTDCHVGPREILKNGRLGQLVPVDDYKALGEAINSVVNGEFLVSHKYLKLRALEFTKNKSCASWENLILAAPSEIN